MLADTISEYLVLTDNLKPLLAGSDDGTNWGGQAKTVLADGARIRLRWMDDTATDKPSLYNKGADQYHI